MAKPKRTTNEPQEYIRITIPLTLYEMEQMHGEEPETLDRDCASCNAWLMWGKTGCVEVEVHRERFMKALFGCEF